MIPPQTYATCVWSSTFKELFFVKMCTVVKYKTKTMQYRSLFPHGARNEPPQVISARTSSCGRRVRLFFVRMQLFLLRCVLACLFIIAFSAACSAQTTTIDSLVVVLRTSPKDTTKVKLLCDIATRQNSHSPLQSLRTAEEAFVLARELNFDRGSASALIAKASSYFRLSRYAEVVRETDSAMQIYEKIGDMAGYANALNLIGNTRRNQGFYADALRLHLRALKLREAINDRSGQATSLNNIANVYRSQQNHPKALEYYQRCMAIDEEHGNVEGISRTTKHIGNIFKSNGQYDSALVYLSRAIRLAYQVGYLPTVSESMQYIGEIYSRQQQYDSALHYLRRAMEIESTLGQKAYFDAVLVQIARTFHQKGDYKEALRYAEYAVRLADTIGTRPDKCDALLAAAETYQALGRFRESSTAFQQYIALNDSLNNEASLRQSAALETQYEMEKKDKEVRILQANQKEQAVLRNALIGGIIALIFLGVVVAVAAIRIRRKHSQLQIATKAVQEQKEILEQQALEIQQSNHELTEKNRILETQQLVLEDQACEIEIANSALHEKNLQLEHLNREKNEFLGIATHDLKNPLTHIIMAVGTIMRYFERMTDSEVQQSVQSIGVVAERMKEIVTNLLDINAIEQGSITLQPVLFDLIPKVTALVEVYTKQAINKSITLQPELPEALMISADEQSVASILDNLLSNAIKYSPLGKSIFIRVQANEYRVRVEFQDEGPGLSPDDMKKLFGKFARLSAQPTGGEHSTGLGLSIVKKMVEAMNGRVWCESELGKGATFIVELPRAI